MRQTLGVQRLTLSDLDGHQAEIETAVDATADIDHWCSGPDWVVSVNAGFGSDGTDLCWRIETEAGPAFALLGRYRLDDGRTMVAGLEPLWGFAAPLVGADIEAAALQLCDTLLADPDWDLLVIPGMPQPAGPSSIISSVVRGLSALGEVRVGTGITRQVADLDGGHDVWLARRGSRFRRNLRRAVAAADDAGLVVVDHSDDPAAFDRLLRIEEGSWKGRDGSGISSPEMSIAYREMVSRLQRRGRARIHVARVAGVDVGYILGGVRAGIYRGLQLSYDETVRDLSVGHLLQYHQVELLLRAGDAALYDLGMDLDYKQRWADRAVPSYTLVFDRGTGS